MSFILQAKNKMSRWICDCACCVYFWYTHHHTQKTIPYVSMGHILYYHL